MVPALEATEYHRLDAGRLCEVSLAHQAESWLDSAENRRWVFPPDLTQLQEQARCEAIAKAFAQPVKASARSGSSNSGYCLLDDVSQGQGWPHPNHAV